MRLRTFWCDRCGKTSQRVRTARKCLCGGKLWLPMTDLLDDDVGQCLLRINRMATGVRRLPPEMLSEAAPFLVAAEALLLQCLPVECVRRATPP